MSIRLSGAQVTRIRETLDRIMKHSYSARYIYHYEIEDLAEEIVKEVLPCPISTHPIPNVQQNANVS